MDRRHNVSSRNINLTFKTVFLHVPWENERQLYKLPWGNRKQTSRNLDLCHLVPSAREFLIKRQVLKAAPPLYQWISHKCSAHPWRYWRSFSPTSRLKRKAVRLLLIFPCQYWCLLSRNSTFSPAQHQAINYIWITRFRAIYFCAHHSWFIKAQAKAAGKIWEKNNTQKVNK